MTKDSKFKKVRLFKVSKELNVAVDTLLDHLKAKGYAGVVDGSGLNASITDEDAYISLLDAFAADRAAASRVKEKRTALRLETEDGPGEYGEHETEAYPEAAPVSTTAEAAPAAPAEVVSAPSVPEAPVIEPVQAVEEPVAAPPVAEAVVAPEPDEVPSAREEEPAEVPAAPQAAPIEEPVAEAAPAVVETPEVDVPVPVAEPVPAPVVEAEAREEVLSPVETAPAPAEPVRAPEPRAAIEPEDEEEETEETEEAEQEEPVAESEAAREAVAEVHQEVLTADRYKLAGTKIIGKIDLAAVEDKSAAAKKKKRKRKRKGEKDTVAPAVPEKKVVATPAVSAAEEAKRKKKRKRGPVVDEAEVQHTMHETLREMEHGVSRVRQRRRRLRREERAAGREREREQAAEMEGVLRVTEFVSTGELANLLNVPVTDIIGMLFKSGMMVSINQRLDADTITFVADEYGHEVEFIRDFGSNDIEVEEDDPEDLKPRAPVVTVMGHVDHGKTSLLDYIRSANVVAGEAGGITQHIGAYNVELKDGRAITFLDTPGHEAFTAMRARGAQATDIVILVVAADDAVMPQTIEAINHARAAEVPIVVAVNKIDKPTANAPRVMQQLADHGVLVEQYGGKAQCALVSAKSGEGVSDLLDRVLLEADLMELKGNPDRMATGIIIESRLEKGRGNVATVLVQNGTLHVGDAFVAGIYSGRVRAMFDEREKRIKQAGPAEPALIVGFDGAPEVGDAFVVLGDEREAREIAQRRQQIHREQAMRQRKHITLDEIGRRLALGDFRELNLIIKADVGGSVEALADSLLKLSTEEVVVNIIHSGVGAITESDVMLASASDAVIIGFQVRPIPGARNLAEREEIDIRLYSIIYDAIEDVRDALEGLLSPEESEKTIGVAEVRNTFRVPKAGTVAGCYVVEGRIHRNDRIRLIRDAVVIYTGSISSLKRFKDDVREVQSGYECGLSIAGFNDLKVGDQIESFEIVETKRKLEV